MTSYDILGQLYIYDVLLTKYFSIISSRISYIILWFTYFPKYCMLWCFSSVKKQVINLHLYLYRNRNLE